MATTDNAIQYDILFVKELLPHLNLKKAQEKHLIEFTKMGIMQRETIAEMAMATVGNFEGDSTQGRDFCDGSDAKTVTISARNNNKSKGAWMNSFEVRNVNTKTGDLRIIAYNKILKRFHYFYIPNYAFAHLRSTLTIVIENATCHVGEPNFTGIPNRNLKFWEFECSSFEEMCNMEPVDIDKWDIQCRN